MKVAVFDAHAFEKDILMKANENFAHELTLLSTRLTEETASLAQGFGCVSIFANDKGNKEVLAILAKGGTKLLALRSAGFNHVDLLAARELGIKVVRVPEYSPYSVAEFAVGLILSLNRKIHKAYSRVREGNFSLDGLVGFDLHGKTVGVIGTGRIGRAFIRIVRGFGCRVLAHDPNQNKVFELEVGMTYTSMDELLSQSDIISLHLPLSAATHHLLDTVSFGKMKPGAMLINTGRGGLIDTKALINSLKIKRLGAAGLDVYEEEETVFFQDHSSEILSDDVLVRLMTFPNVILTSHQGFLTSEALENISETTLQNIFDFEKGQPLLNEISPK